MDFHRGNFFKRTFCIFKAIDFVEDREADHVSSSGSRYWFRADGVYRRSSHWGRIGDCRWRLEGHSGPARFSYGGFAYWTDFWTFDAHQKLFWFDSERPGRYYHYEEPEYAGQPLFAEQEAIKRVRKLKNER